MLGVRSNDTVEEISDKSLRCVGYHMIVEFLNENFQFDGQVMIFDLPSSDFCYLRHSL
jgi:hypothetical protein